MTFEEARNLHNGDEVTIKKTGVVTTVCDAYVQGNTVLIDCFYDGITTFTHKEVE